MNPSPDSAASTFVSSGAIKPFPTGAPGKEMKMLRSKPMDIADKCPVHHTRTAAAEVVTIVDAKRPS